MFHSILVNLELDAGLDEQTVIRLRRNSVLQNIKIDTSLSMIPSR